LSGKRTSWKLVISECTFLAAPAGDAEAERP
jgi:hypothetical protein